MRAARGLSAPFLSSSSPDDVLYTPRCLVAPFWYVRWFGGRQDGRIGVAFLGCGASHVKCMTVKEAGGGGSSADGWSAPRDETLGEEHRFHTPNNRRSRNDLQLASSRAIYLLVYPPSESLSMWRLAVSGGDCFVDASLRSWRRCDGAQGWIL